MCGSASSTVPRGRARVALEPPVQRGEGTAMQDKAELRPGPRPGTADACAARPHRDAGLAADLAARIGCTVDRAVTGARQQAVPAATPTRPRLIFGFDATASRRPAWTPRARSPTRCSARCLASLTWRLPCTAGPCCTHLPSSLQPRHTARPRRRHQLYLRPDPASADPVACPVGARCARCHLYRRRVRGIPLPRRQTRRRYGCARHPFDCAARRR